MKNWIHLLNERGTRTDKLIKPQVIAAAVSAELEDDAIISVDSGTITTWAVRCINIRKGMKLSIWHPSKDGM